jgi:hypothetical protein
MLRRGREIRKPPTPRSRAVKPTNARTTAKPNKTNHQSRKGVRPTLRAIIHQKSTMEEAAQSANSIEENI